MGTSFNKSRFIPFVVLHEFEGLLFSDCRGFSHGIERPDLEGQFQAIRDGFSTPEEINDSPSTAPSKRIEQIYPKYQKTIAGPPSAAQIGLDAIRRECPHFNDWIQRLEAQVR